VNIALEVNGEPRTVEASPWKRLLDVLREDLRLTGTKEGCGEGECGACTVILDGDVVNSCLVAIGQCDARSVMTVEGLARGEVLHAVQRALVACGGAQCGICTPGIAVCAAHVIDTGLIAGISERSAEMGGDPAGLAGGAGDNAPHGISDATARARVRELLAGNICRCTGYQLIVDAVIAAAREVARAPASEPASEPTSERAIERV
jgi:carbon-monoxide dehydrogenase small subunit